MKEQRQPQRSQRSPRKTKKNKNSVSSAVKYFSKRMIMVKCIFCRREIGDELLYCSYCGKPQKMTCPGCGKEIPLSSEVCQFCEIDVAGFESAKATLDGAEKVMERCDYTSARAGFEELITNKFYGDRAKKMIDEIDERIKVYKEGVKDGDDYLKQGRLVRARNAFRRAVKANPCDHHSYLKIAETEKRLRVLRLKKGSLVLVILLLSLWGFYHHYRTRLDVIAITQLESLLAGELQDIRDASALTLGWRGERRGIPTLREMLHTDNPEKKIYVLSALAMAGEGRAIAPLLNLAVEGEEPTRIAALYCIYKVLGDMRLIPVDENDSLVFLTRGLLELSLGDTSDIDVVRETLGSKDNRWIFATLYLITLLGEEKIVPFLIPDINPHLQSDDMEIRTISALVLQEAGVRDIPLAEEVLWESLQVEEIISSYRSLVNTFSLLRNIVLMQGDEEFLSSPDITSLRERLHILLFTYELGTLTKEEHIIPLLSSSDIYDNLIANLYLFITEREKGPKEVLTTFLRQGNERVRFATAKLVLEFTL